MLEATVLELADRHASGACVLFGRVSSTLTRGTHFQNQRQLLGALESAVQQRHDNRQGIDEALAAAGLNERNILS